MAYAKNTGKKISSLSVFFPTLNDAPVLPDLISKAINAAEAVAKKYEIIVIDDGSTDNTQEVLSKLSNKYKQIRVIRNPRPTGYGGALQKGFAACRYDWIFYTDGDGQYDPQELALLAKKATFGFTVVNGYKKKRADSLSRTLGGTFYNWLVHNIYALPIRDIDCDFRLIKRSLMKKTKLKNKSAVVCLELILKLQEAGASFAEVPVSHYPRKHGKSAFFQFGNVYKTLKELTSGV